MKHTAQITAFLVILFLVTQLFGLYTVSKNIDVAVDSETGVQVISHQDTIVGPPPKTESGTQSVLMIFFAVLIGTGLIFLLIKLKVHKLWRYWYMLAVFITMSITLGVYVDFFSANTNFILILLFAGFLAWKKVYQPTIVVHNLTEIMVYTGIAVLFASFFEGFLWAAFAIMILISLYDMFAVWQSKHMIKLAKYQQESKVFAGLSIPYGGKKPKKGDKVVVTKQKVALLGGGDIAFPLIFSTGVLTNLIVGSGVSKLAALGYTSIISLTATASLLYLFVTAEKGKFYPAMPYITLGCFVGAGIIWLIL